MNVDDVVAERIAAARYRIEQQRAERERRRKARAAGLARRHAAKLRHLIESQPRNPAPPGALRKVITDDEG